LSTEELYHEKPGFHHPQTKQEQAFQFLFQQYYNRIFGNTLQLVKIRAVAEDIAQQVFMKAWEKREQLTDLEQPAAWLFQIARNLMADRLRDEFKKEQYTTYALELLEMQSASPEDVLMLRQKRELLHRSVQTLSPRQKEVYRLSTEEGLSYHEIADRLGITRDTVKEHLQIARTKIKQYLSEHREELIGLILLSEIFY
jgi:RNA polymerase sigma-70 factor (ECF subfamily)